MTAPNSKVGTAFIGLSESDFFEAASKAILEGNSEFFREVARLLETRIEGTSDHWVDFAVNIAFDRLRGLYGKLPTKKQVRDSALEWRALTIVIKRALAQGSGFCDIYFFPDGQSKAEMKPELHEQVRKEIERLPEQNWTAIFKRCGLSDLPNDKGGQPTHRKRGYCR